MSSIENAETVESYPVPNTTALVTKDAFDALQSDSYKALSNGIQFNVDGDGKLIPIPVDQLDPLIDVLRTIGSVDNWYVGDTALAIKELYGEEAVAEFAERIGKRIEQVKKYMSINKNLGFPNKLAENRHPDPNVTHGHHQKVLGIKDPKQRMKLLQECSDAGESVADFYIRVKKFNLGLGPDEVLPQKSDGSEYGVFRPSFRIYDPKVDNEEQFLTEFFDRVRKIDFPEYIKPELRKAREEKERREYLADKLPIELKNTVLTDPQYAGLEMEKFEKVVGKLIEDNEERKKIEKEIEKMKIPTGKKGERDLKLEEEARAEAKKKIKDDGIKDVEAAKPIIKKILDAAKSRRKDNDRIEKLINQIKDEKKRSEIFELVEEQKLLLVQIEELVKPIITEEIIREETERLRSGAAADKAGRIIRPPQRKKSPDGKKATAELPLGKGSKKSTKKGPAKKESPAQTEV